MNWRMTIIELWLVPTPTWRRLPCATTRSGSPVFFVEASLTLTGSPLRSSRSTPWYTARCAIRRPCRGSARLEAFGIQLVGVRRLRAREPSADQCLLAHAQRKPRWEVDVSTGWADPGRRAVAGAESRRAQNRAAFHDLRGNALICGRCSARGCSPCWPPPEKAGNIDGVPGDESYVHSRRCRSCRTGRRRWPGTR